MNRVVFSVLFVFVSWVAYPQSITEEQLATIKEYEQTLKKIGLVLFYSEEYEQRRDANYTFIQEFTKALKVENSYQYDFPELPFLKIIEPEDQSFRFITWQMESDAKLIRHYGAIQLNSKELKLFPLIDRSDDMAEPAHFVGDNTKWFGAIYYDIIELGKGKQKKYALLGIDSHTPLSNKKVVDILQFDSEGKPIFGGLFFTSWAQENRKATRFIIEYKGDASVSLRYDIDKKMIIFDHLVPIDEASESIFMNYVPDGTFDGLKWNGKEFLFETNIVPTVVEIPESNSMDRETKSNQFYKPNKSNK